MPPLDMESSISTELSTGYLQDAVAGWSDRCKRRRTPSCPLDSNAVTTTEEIQDLFQGFWDSNCYENPLENLSYMFQDDDGILSDDKWMWNNKKQEEKNRPVIQHKLSMPLSSHETIIPKASLVPLKERETEVNAKKAAARVVYPFAVVKPAGFEGDATLADINERILMRPTRPVRHPVGESPEARACRLMGQASPARRLWASQGSTHRGEAPSQL